MGPPWTKKRQLWCMEKVSSSFPGIRGSFRMLQRKETEIVRRRPSGIRMPFGGASVSLPFDVSECSPKPFSPHVIGKCQTKEGTYHRENQRSIFSMVRTVRVDSLPHRKWREIQQQPGTAGPGNMLGCCLIFFHFLWGKLSTRTVHSNTMELGSSE